ncbi:MAG: twin-arginine translocation signal domain-containing protein, partial [Bacteroidales bacterium]|nr:twin-arginine translocation signal domain-containing protein [Bacteroidales bacterium]
MKRRSFLKGAAWAAVGAAVAPELLSCTPKKSLEQDLRVARDFHYGLVGQFKLLQFTDTHCIAGDPRSERALRCVEEMLERERPDLVIHTVDIVFG